MNIIHLDAIPETVDISPKGKYASTDKEISIAHGREPTSTDLRLRHPFDVAITKIPPGKANCPYHSHSAQWEYYQVLKGEGEVRDPDGYHPIREGDTFLFPPDIPHQLRNTGTKDLEILIVADNPLGESGYYPDSGKWMVRSPQRKLLRSQALDYFDGEE